MNVDQYFILLQATHAVPLCIAAVRYNKIDVSYHPFIWLLFLGFVNETINYISIKIFRTNSISFNTFNVIEFLLLLYQFRVWGFFKNRSFYYILLIVGIAGWICENFLFSKITVFNPYFRILYAFVIELLIANRLIYVVNEKASLAKNPTFLICVGLIVLYMYQIVFETAMLSPAPTNATTRLLIRALGYTDILVQLLYSWAFLVAPVKKSLIWQEKIKLSASDIKECLP